MTRQGRSALTHTQAIIELPFASLLTLAAFLSRAIHLSSRDEIQPFLLPPFLPEDAWHDRVGRAVCHARVDGAVAQQRAAARELGGPSVAMN